MPKVTSLTPQSKLKVARKKRVIPEGKKLEGLPIPFDEFYSVLAVLDGFDHIPDIHCRFIDFFTSHNDWKNGTGVLQSFRNSAKSSVVAGFIVWLLVRNPSTIVVIQSADDITAQKTISDCQRIIAIHPAASHLRSDNCVWTARGFRVKGATSGRNLSVTARGIFSNVTGSRADWIIFDDIEVPRNAGSSELRDKLRARISEASHLLNPDGRRLFVGTPHSDASIYPELIDDHGAASLRIPLFKGNMAGAFPFFTGVSNWPERWTASEIAKKQALCKSKAEFLSQYQLIPRSSEEATLDPTLLKMYTLDIEVVEANGSRVRRLGDKQMRDVATFWDPAPSRGDGSVLAIVYQDNDGNLYLHRTLEVRGNADQQCLFVRDFLVANSIGRITIETNGVGAFLPETLRKYTRGLDIAVLDQHTSKKKVVSIIEAFETPMSAGFLYVHESVLASPFLGQMRDFPRSRKDDYIDASAKAIHLLPIRIGRGQRNSIEGFSPINSLSEPMEIERDYAFH